MADKSQKINGWTDDKIHSAISVSIDYSDSKELVYFIWKAASNHKNWQCFDYITSWLKDNDIWFSVSRFQVNECEIFVHNQEARTMLKLMFKDTKYVDRRLAYTQDPSPL